MKSLLRFTAVIFLVGSMCISDGVESFSFSDLYCSPLPIREWNPLHEVRPQILIGLLKRHYAPDHRSEHSTCIQSTARGSSMWARADCVDPTSNYCIGCLMMATSYLDSKCMYFSGGRISEKSGICAMQFGDYDVCAQ